MPRWLQQIVDIVIYNQDTYFNTLLIPIMNVNDILIIKSLVQNAVNLYLQTQHGYFGEKPLSIFVRNIVFYIGCEGIMTQNNILNFAPYYTVSY